MVSHVLIDDFIPTDVPQFSILFAIFTLDRLGRRKSLYLGSVGMGISMFISGGFARAALTYKDKTAAYDAAAASFTFVFIVGFGATWLTIPRLASSVEAAVA